MEEKNQNPPKTKKKKGGLIAAIVIIVLIIALIAGGLSWMFISGNDFSTIIDNIKESFENKDKKEENTKDDKDANNNTSYVNPNDKPENVEDPNDKEDISGKGGNNENNTNLKDSFKVTYETRGVRNISVGGANFVCNEDVPKISGISSTAASKIEKYLNNWYSEVWKDINAQTEDDYIKEILTQMNENSGEYGPADIGFHQTYKVSYLTNKLVTFQYIFEGGLGGVSWGNTSGVSFDLKTGDVIEIEKIVTSKDKYIDACKKYVFAELKKDSRYEEVLEMHGNEYEEIINSAIEKLGGYFTEDGIVCAEIPKYSIASGASGEFVFTVPYSEIKDYINSYYLSDTTNDSKANTKESNNNVVVDNSNGYTPEQLEKMALDYYEAKTGYRPKCVASDVNQDGTVSIQLYDNMGDHNSTADWYTVNAMNATGEDIMGNKIDLKVKPTQGNK